MDISEQQLVDQLQGGDKSAPRMLYCRYAGSLAAVCARYVADGDDVKDVMQDVFVKAFTQISTFAYRGEGSLKAWLIRITVNQSLTFLKNAGRLPTVSDEARTAEIANEEPPDADGVPPEELQRMIKSLPTGYRTVLNLYVFEDKSHKEIAELLGIKPASSASQLFHAKAMMARMIKEYKRTH